MKKKTVIIICCAALVAACGVYFVAHSASAGASGPFYSAGAYLRQAMDNEDGEKEPATPDDAMDEPNGAESAAPENIAATYKDQVITWNEVEYMRNIAFMFDSSYTTTDKDIVDRLIRGKILSELAEERGVAATQEEMDELIENTRKAYAIPDGKAMLDEYCEGLGVDFEGYLEILSAQAYDTITMQKMRNRIAMDICEERGIEYSNPLPQDVQDEMNSRLDSLVDQYRQYVKYYF